MSVFSLFVHFPAVLPITMLSRNGLNFQMRKNFMQMQIQVTLQTYGTITTVCFFSEK